MRCIFNGLFVSLAFFMLISSSAFGQCKGFAQKKCMPELGDFRPNGSLYANYMEDGQETELNVVLIGGQKYRLLHCHRQGLGKVWIQLFDNKDKLVFDNSEHNFVTTWDFTVKSTQEFTVRTFISGVGDVNDPAARSCAVLLLGNKLNE